MPKSRTPSTGSGSGTAESVGKSSISSSVGSILSRVLGSFRRLSRDDDKATANNNKSGASTFKITHRPDRPRHDKREGLRDRNSVYVLAQLRRIWQHNENMAETKGREREAKAQAAASGFEDPRNRGQSSRADERDRRIRGNSDDDSSTGRRTRPRAPTLQTDLMPNFSRKASSPEISRSKWRADGEEAHRAANSGGKYVEQHGRFAYSPSSPALSSDQMTIRVGMVQSPYAAEEGEWLKMAPGRAEDGGYSLAQDDTSASSVALRPPPRSFTPSAMSPMRPVALFPSSAQRNEASRGQQIRSGPEWSQTNKNVATHPANATQASMSARGKASQQRMTTLYINASEDSTPSLVQNSSPVSEASAPITPIDASFDDDDNRDILMNRKVLPTEPHTSKTCPLCGDALRTSVDYKQNLCAACRNELQPRQSIFVTDVLNPFSYSRPPINARPKPRISLFPTIRPNPTAGAGAARANKPLETLRDLDSEGKHARTGSGTVSDHKSRDGARETKEASDAGAVSSRFNKERRGFKLQPPSLNRKPAQKVLRSQLGDLSPSPSPPPSTAPAERQRRDGSDNDHGRNHIGYQLAGWPQPPSHPPAAAAATAPPLPPLPPSTAPGAPPPPDSRARRQSGPLLEPKTFRPVTPPTRPKKDAAIIIPRRKPSGSRARFKPRGVATTSGGGGGVHVERAGGIRRGNGPRSPGHRRNRHNHQPQAQHAEHWAGGQDTSVTGGKGTASDDTAAAAREIDTKPSLSAGSGGLDLEDIYREIDTIIDSYLWRPDASKSENEKRKVEAVATYFTEVPFDVEMRLKGFI
ncbi:hypothetical protein F5B17DRAFT_71180 [Nemania serpens]|nr:hypothetical protein F5B17DRAFT_71180 [Nemania serpens]